MVVTMVMTMLTGKDGVGGAVLARVGVEPIVRNQKPPVLVLRDGGYIVGYINGYMGYYSTSLTHPGVSGRRGCRRPALARAPELDPAPAQVREGGVGQHDGLAAAVRAHRVDTPQVSEGAAGEGDVAGVTDVDVDLWEEGGGE